MISRKLAPFLDSPAEAGLFIDFDGTLSELALRPDEARPIEGAVDVLADLGRRFRLVAVVSGRSARQLADWLGPGVEIWGTHGAESVLDGEVAVAERAANFAELMGRVKEEARRALEEGGPPGALLEDKGIVINLHWRTADDPAAAEGAIESLSAELAHRHGVWIAKGKMSIELRPPIELTKAAVVLERASELELEAAAFIGDDKVDLPGFDALDALAAEGVSTLRVAVDSDEAPPELIARADVIVHGPAGALELLRSLTGMGAG